jgi:hypothetical protein
VDIDLRVLLAITTAYGAVVTKLVDFIRNTVGKKSGGTERELPKWLWQVCGFAIGVAVAYLFQVDAFTGDNRWGQLLTGLAIGAAGSGLRRSCRPPPVGRAVARRS